MKTRSQIVLVVVSALSIWVASPVAVSAAESEIDCLKCHAKLKSGKVVHPALEMGCTVCHSGIDARTVPHKKKNGFFMGLSEGGEPDLCYGCHDKEKFTRKNVHAPLTHGCFICHNPHSAKNEKLLVANAPDLCFSCHKTRFANKIMHAPVEGGMCLSCHSPHSSDQMALLLKPPVEVCLECHPEIPQKQHAISGFSATSHPVGLPKTVSRKRPDGRIEEVKEYLTDPSQPGKVFYCGSCHHPHSSSVPHLFRFNATTTMGLCSHCHKV